jgi:hypothetical protein
VKPSVGRIVHYVSYGTPGGEYSRECRAAVITEVPGLTRAERGETVGLCVLNPTGLFLNRDIRLDEGHHDAAGSTNLCGGLDYAGGTWHFPEIIREPGDRPPRH